MFCSRWAWGVPASQPPLVRDLVSLALPASFACAAGQGHHVPPANLADQMMSLHSLIHGAPEDCALAGASHGPGVAGLPVQGLPRGTVCQVQLPAKSAGCAGAVSWLVAGRGQAAAAQGLPAVPCQLPGATAQARWLQTAALPSCHLHSPRPSSPGAACSMAHAVRQARCIIISQTCLHWMHAGAAAAAHSTRGIARARASSSTAASCCILSRQGASQAAPACRPGSPSVCSNVPHVLAHTGV